jgi:hypothetical protein
MLLNRDDAYYGAENNGVIDNDKAQALIESYKLDNFGRPVRDLKQRRKETLMPGPGLNIAIYKHDRASYDCRIDTYGATSARHKSLKGELSGKARIAFAETCINRWDIEYPNPGRLTQKKKLCHFCLHVFKERCVLVKHIFKQCTLKPLSFDYGLKCQYCPVSKPAFSDFTHRIQHDQQVHPDNYNGL